MNIIGDVSKHHCILVDDIVEIVINLNSGQSTGTAWGCDLSKKYVEINSEYTT